MRRPTRIFLRLLFAAGLLAAACVVAVVAYVAVNCRDLPPPDLGGLALPPPAPVPAASNGWYGLREAVRDMCVPSRTSRLAAAWYGLGDAASLREILASNTLSLAWIDRAVRGGTLAPPAARLPEDDSYLGWSPVTVCGRLLRLRAQEALLAGRTNAALAGYAESVALARLYLGVPPGSDLDALAAFTEVRDAIFHLRLASGRLGVRQVWDALHGDLEALGDLDAARRRAIAAALANDRRNLEQMCRIVAGDSPSPAAWGSPIAAALPDAVQRARANGAEQAALRVYELLPAGYRFQPNRTLAAMLALRSGTAPPELVAVAREAAQWPGGPWDWKRTLAPVLQVLGPNGLGEVYILGEAGRLPFIDGGARLAETAARGTWLALALRVCEEDRGTLPATPDELVPRWLPAVPRDPYDGRPFRYDRGRRLAYSVGRNRRDDGGVRDVLHGGVDALPGDDVLFDVPR